MRSMTAENFVGLIELNPKTPPANHPVIDTITRKMTAALHGKKEVGSWTDGQFQDAILTFGSYICTCGCCVGAVDFLLPNGFLADPLAVHYLAYHRDEIPEKVLTAIAEFPYGERQPAASELIP